MATTNADLYDANGFAVVDFETTGFSYGRGDRVVEVGVVRLDPEGEIVGTFETLINPLRDVGVTHVHGIAASDVISAPTFADISDHFAAILDGSVFVAHNARFDEGFARNELAANGNFLGSSIPYIDTQALSLRYVDSRSQKLSDVIDALGIENSHAHSALADALATAEVLRYFLRQTRACQEPSWNDAVTATSSCRDYRYVKPLMRPAHLTRGSAAQARNALRSGEWISAAVGARDTPDDSLRSEYFRMLDHVFLDRELSHAEGNALLSFAARHSLSRVALERLHEEYLRLLVASAWSDGVVTDKERATIEIIGRYLGVSQEQQDSLLEQTVARPAEVGDTGGLLDTKITLAPGDRVTITGPKLRSRTEWEEFFGAHGVTVAGLAKSSKILIAGDTNSMSSKAKKAREYGISLVSEAAVLDLIRFSS